MAKLFYVARRCAAVVVFVLYSISSHANAVADKPLVNLHLTVSWGEMNDKRIPFFNIKVTNVSHTTLRGLDIRKRPDFIDSFLDVQIIPLNHDFELSRMIGDPNVINKSDFVELAPGQSVEFKAIVLPIDYRELVPGRYKAYAIYRIDPIRRPNEIYRSDDVFFKVK